MDVLDSSVASSAGGISSVEGSVLSSGDEDARPSGTVERVDKAVAIKRRRSTIRKPRTKGVTKKLQNQLEFYFGEANLPKDKFLKEQIEQNDGYVPVEVLASFKKMKSLSTDKSLVLRAIKNSSMLELSEDSCKVRRCCPLPVVPQSDVDLRTVYVENLSVASADHDSVSKMFKVFGDVKFVSLPRYKTSGIIKGFAFVEFSTQEAATKAVEYFRLKDTLPATQRNRKPSKMIEDVLEKASYAETVASVARSEEEMVVEDSVSSTKGVAEEEGVPKEGGVVEKGVASEGGVIKKFGEGGVGRVSISDEQSLTKEKVRGEVAEPLEGRKRKREEVKKERRLIGGVEEQREETTGEEGEGGERGRKFGRREGEEVEEMEKKWEREVEGRRKREREDCEDLTRKEEDSAPGISSRPPTKRSKLETISEDDTEVSELEAECLGKEGGAQGKETGEGKKEGVGQEMSDQGTKKKRSRQRSRKKQWPPGLKECNLRVMAKTEWLNMKEIFKNLQKTHMKSVKSEVTTGAAAQPHDKRFVKECLVKVELEQEWEETRRNSLKEFCGQHGEVAFIDLKDGDTMGHVRFKQSGCVEGVVQSTSKPPGLTFSTVEEADERAYFLKTQAERKQRAMIGKKGLKQRGRDKLISRVLKRSTFDAPPPTKLDVGVASSSQHQPTHIRFSDSD